MTISDEQWARLTDDQKDCEAFTKLWPVGGLPGCEIYGLTSTWRGFGLVVERMKGYVFDIKTAGTSTLVICGKEEEAVTYDAIVDGPPDKAAPSAAALAAVRAMEKKNG